MSALIPPLTKEDFITSGWKEVIDSSERKECRFYYENFRKKAQNIKDTGEHRQYAVLNILQSVTVAPIRSELDGESLMRFAARFPDEYIDFLSEIVDEVSDPELQARIAEILWVKKADYKMGRLAVEAYLESAKQLEDPQKWSRCVDRIERALSLARKINYKYKTVFAYIDEVLNRYQGKDPLWLSRKLHKLLQEEQNINILRKEQLLDTAKYVALAEKGAIFSESTKEWDKARNYWEIKAEWHRIEKNSEKAYKARMLAAETYVEEAEYSLDKHPTPYFKASHDLREALEALERLKSQSTEEERTAINTKSEEIHKLLLEYQQNSFNELIIIPSEFNMNDEVELAIVQVKGKEFLDAILSLASLGTPPKISNLRQTLEETAKLSSFFPKVIINGMGKVVAHQPTNPNQAEEAIRFEMYMMAVEYQKIHAQAFIEPARYQIISEHIIPKLEDDKIKETDLLPLVSNNPFVPPGRENLFAKGLYAGLIGDFVTSTHILIPQIENSVRYMLSNRGAITSGIDNKNNGVQKENYLTATLYPSKYREITSIFDEDTLFDLQGLLVEHSGSNLRNLLAHGLISDNEFSSPIMSYLWWVTLRLCIGLGILIPQQLVEETNPWVKFAGMFKDDPFRNEFEAEMAAYRRELDAEIAADEASLEEYKSA